MDPFTERMGASVARTQAAWGGFRRQPSWVVWAAVTTFMLVIVVPMVLLVLFAAAAAAVVFGVLYVIDRIGQAFRGLLPRRDGRDNVRVIGPDR